MCGIFGLIFNNSRHQYDIAEIVTCIKEKLHHRGPDYFGTTFTTRKNVTDKISKIEKSAVKMLLCHSRLSIIDLSDKANQPFISKDSRYQIIFNGEIYNYRSLKKSLKKKGVIFNSTSDTEVLFKGLITEGKQFISKLEGMFSFAFFDKQTNQLLLARDHFGIKPLYYHSGEYGFSFCSEIPPLLDSLKISPTVNSTQLFDYLHYFGTSDYNKNTFFKDIYQLLPGHYLEYNINSHHFKISQYWSAKLRTPINISRDDATLELRKLFIQSVTKHLESDVDIAVALSGGIDSSSICCVINNLLPEKRINTFSYITDEPKQSEKHFADIITNKINSQPHLVSISSNQFVSDIEKLIFTQAQPFRSSSMYSQYRVFRSIHNNQFKVVIDGQGADELLGGYTYFIGDRATSLLLKGQIISLFKLIKSSRKDGRALHTISKAIANIAPDFLYPAMAKIYGNSLTPNWLNQAWIKDNQLYQTTINRQFEYIEKDVLKGSLVNSLQSNGIRKLLRYQDHNSMAHSVESRVPFLDVPLAEFILSLPEDLLIDNNGTTKSIFRSAMTGIVPNEILRRRDKIGFNTPEMSWLTKEKDYVYDVLHMSKKYPIFNTKKLIEDWDNVLSGKKKFHPKIWLWINTILWVSQFKVNID